MNAIIYPCIMVSEQGTVVCMSSEGIGHVISSDDSTTAYTKGYYSNEWDMRNFSMYVFSEQPVYYYQWVKLVNGQLLISDYMTDTRATALRYTEKEGWTKKLSSKTTLEEMLK